MILVAQRRFSNDFILENMLKYKNIFDSQDFLSLFPQAWQLLENFPNQLKNGQSWLVSEEIIRYSFSKFSFDKLELYLLNERVTARSQKYLVNLSLSLTKHSELLAKINLTLLSEESWNENIQKNK